VDALFGEILSSCGKLQWVVDNGEDVLRTEVRPTNFTSMHKRAELRYEPLGVIGVIAPWNYPQYNFLNHVASGLFAGNAVVIKMSEYTAWTAQHIIRIYRDVLRAAGQDPDLVQVVQGFGETGAALVNTADKVIFTGSPGVGRAVMKGASETLTPLVLELGGKDPFIVCDDADATSALTLAMRGTFQVSYRGGCAWEVTALRPPPRFNTQSPPPLRRGACVDGRMRARIALVSSASTCTRPSTTPSSPPPPPP